MVFNRVMGYVPMVNELSDCKVMNVVKIDRLLSG